MDRRNSGSGRNCSGEWSSKTGVSQFAHASCVQLSNEFKFPIAAFHHAHEAYLVPDLIKQAWGKAPALALFSSFARLVICPHASGIQTHDLHIRYKREAYRGSEFASRILNDNDLRIVMKVSFNFLVRSFSDIGYAAV